MQTVGLDAIKMLFELILHFLLCIATSSLALKSTFDPQEIQKHDFDDDFFYSSKPSAQQYDFQTSEAATPIPLESDFHQNNLQKLSHRFLDKALARLPYVVKGTKAAYHVLRWTLLGMLADTMVKLERNTQHLKSIYLQNKDLMDTGDLVPYVDETYSDLALLYNEIDKNQRTVHPIDILGAYDELRKGNEVMSSILGYVEDKVVYRENDGWPIGDHGWSMGDQGWSMGDRYSSVIDWAYYDYNLN